MPDIYVNCKVIRASLPFSDSRPLFISSYQTNKQEALDELAKSLFIIFQNMDQVYLMSSLEEMLILLSSIGIRGLQQNHPQLLITDISSSSC